MKSMLTLIWSLFCSRSSQWIDGDQAYYDGKAEERNPHPEGTAAHEQWRRGFYGDSSP
jgi:hypothetical protein